jgi:hypothetical protein
MRSSAGRAAEVGTKFPDAVDSDSGLLAVHAGIGQQVMWDIRPARRKTEGGSAGSSDGFVLYSLMEPRQRENLVRLRSFSLVIFAELTLTAARPKAPWFAFTFTPMVVNFGPTSVAVDSSGNTYLAGSVVGSPFTATPGAYQSQSAGGTCYGGQFVPVPIGPCREAATVLYSGSAPTFESGFFQINVRLPADLTAGVEPLYLRVAGVTSAPATLSIQ